MKIAEINDLPLESLVERLGGIYEHSPWVIERAAAGRPFVDLTALICAMRESVEQASPAEQRDLICAHPDLAGKLARAGQLTDDSTREQSGLGLDQLSDEEFVCFEKLNAAYREKFGMPFIICARMTTKSKMLQAFRDRLLNDQSTECEAALREIHHIARLRLEDRFITIKCDSRFPNQRHL